MLGAREPLGHFLPELLFRNNVDNERNGMQPYSYI